MSSILQKILVTKRLEIARAMEEHPLADLRALAESSPPPRDFLGAISGKNEMGLIAEIKKASPSKGLLRPDFDPVWIAERYAWGGAHALSVLTDRDYFQGDLVNLRLVRQVVSLPLLRKDFLIDPYQLYEARAHGADAILLIAECLAPALLMQLHDLAVSLGLQPLIELHQLDNLPHVLATGCRLIGINNRDLHTFQVDFDRTLRLREQIPADRCVVAESGIHSPRDVAKLWQGGVQAMLVGESLIRQPDPGQAVRDLLQPPDEVPSAG